MHGFEKTLMNLKITKEFLNVCAEILKFSLIFKRKIKEERKMK